MDAKRGSTAGATLGEALRKNKKPVDWRFPDESGLSERTLDCRQLAVKEVLRWKGADELIPVFLTPFDSTGHGLLLRRSEPRLQRGWGLETCHPEFPEEMEGLLRSVFDREGYALLFYKAFDMPFSAYYGIHDVIHWSLVTDFDETHITLLDSAGAPSYFDGMTGRIPSGLFFEAWTDRQPVTSGAAFVTGAAPPFERNWEDEFAGIVRQSVTNMGTDERLEQFIREFETAPLGDLTAHLDQLEFDLHYYRRLRELWLLAALRGAVPARYLKPAWVEELTYVCRCWSLVLGVLMKWKRQPDRDYREKVLAYLRQTLDNETSFFEALAEMAGEEE
ncbi:hypothetical protein P4H65_13070 [Paenibacillus chitinolyticus]|uniref:hypothetical protein n=1 Tax=Paenibacillus chitinolyticus TaxID=79263 RepID=UPI002DB828A6|nr:hypothetical protein [Paenibacillus chitinolyticus]MEC0246719.1 hypothetical protein [Paenibacillus chitinolyticus]